MYGTSAGHHFALDAEFLLPETGYQLGHCYNAIQTGPNTHIYCAYSWWRGTVVERLSLTGELSLSCARPAADG